jgi:hypothetical protein
MAVKKFVTNPQVASAAPIDWDCECGQNGIESPRAAIDSPIESLDKPRCVCKRPKQTANDDDVF